MGDIDVFGRGMSEHNECLQKLIEVLKSVGLKLNIGKCMLRKTELHYLGHVIIKDGVTQPRKSVSESAQSD